MSAVPGWFLLGYSGPEVIEAGVRNSGAFLLNSARIWGPATLLLLIWSVAARPWTRWWAGRAASRSSIPGHVHALASLLIVIVLLALLLLAS